MKILLTSILLIFSISCCAIPTDYIDGKWYSCQAWTVNDAGDTLFYSSSNGWKVWISYNKKHQKTGYRWSYGTTAKIAYTLNGHIQREDWSDGTWFRKKYNSKGQVVLFEGRGIRTIYEYDSLGNEIYSKETNENWKNMVGTTELWNEYYSDGTIKYKYREVKFDDGSMVTKYIGKEWFDTHGYVVMDSSFDGVNHYVNKYDQYGMIIYEGKERTWYTYFRKDDTFYKCIDDKKQERKQLTKEKQ